MRRKQLSAGGEMIYLPAVLKRIRHLYDVKPSTDTLDRGKHIREVWYYESADYILSGHLVT